MTTCLIWTYRELTVRHLIEHEGRDNANLTRAFANSVWDRYRDFVLKPIERSREELMADPVLCQLRSDVIAKMEGLPIVKIKIYNVYGLTIFSTDEAQIGEDKSTNQAFLDARAGSVTYQPRLDIVTRRVVAIEALLRWINPSQGLRLPAEFISVLEDAGMINIMGEWVLRTVCAQISSLNYLRQFDVDFLNIDRSFVTEISSNARARAVASAIINLAKDLDIIVVAEGVKTEEQAHFFSSANCGEMQGFLFCKPLPVDQLVLYLAAPIDSRIAHRADDSGEPQTSYSRTG